MNRAYRLVWDEFRNMLVIVAENSRNRGKKAGQSGRRALLAAAGAAVLALPVMGGEAWGANATCSKGEAKSWYGQEGANSVACGLGAQVLNNNGPQKDGNGNTIYETQFGGAVSLTTHFDAQGNILPYNMGDNPGQTGNPWRVTREGDSTSPRWMTTAELTAANNAIPDGDPKWGKVTVWNAKLEHASNSVAIARSAHTHEQYAVAIGVGSDATGKRSIAIGSGDDMDAQHQVQAAGVGSIAFGNMALTKAGADVTGTATKAENSIAIGTNVHTTEDNAVAIGVEANAWQQKSVALGADSQATRAAGEATGWKAGDALQD